MSIEYLQELLILEGIDTTKFEESFVENNVRQRIGELRFKGFGEYVSYLSENQGEAKMLSLLYNNNYSEFFRNPLSYAVLEKIVLPDLFAGKRNQDKELRIWSVACASGQEPYSLAILVEELMSSQKVPFRYRIFATDKSEMQIEHAVKGYYFSQSAGKVTLMRLSKWFDLLPHTGNETQYMIKECLKKYIDFSVFDLFDDHTGVPPSSIYGNFDIVVCANFLFYYKPYWRKLILDKVIDSVKPGGVLMVGDVERELLNQQGFTEIFYRSGLFQI